MGVIPSLLGLLNSHFAPFPFARPLLFFLLLIMLENPTRLQSKHMRLGGSS